ncbi:Mitochondrial outer membrane import complex protein METAXIN [Ananas comosus]|uniref:Metaxin n=1 Tax=Ananas comosus TaxID=4615 RepID=A0A199VZN6_ANACO|nr:Mitochondrial outer membrane import complex protein METAXIN [Ananas comosus]
MGDAAKSAAEAAEEAAEEGRRRRLVLVARKGGFGLPTACPSCLPVYLYLRLARVPFDLEFDLAYPDADHIPYVEYGDYVAFNSERGGVIECLKEDKIVDLDSSKLASHLIPELLSTKAMVTSWLADAVQYELWVATDRSVAHKIYFSDLPWPIGKVLHWKKSREVKQLLNITNVNAEEKAEEIYRNANSAYDALSMRLGDQVFFFDNRPTEVDALFLGHALFVLHVLPDTSVLRSNLLKHENLVKYAEHLKVDLLENGSSSSSSSLPRPPFETSTSSTPRRRASPGWSSKPKPKTKRERTEEEKTFRRRAKYFLAAQLAAVLVFLSLMGGADSSELDDGDDEMAYEGE